MNNNLIIIKKNSIIKRVITFFKRLFSKKHHVHDKNIIENLDNNVKDKFLNDIKFEEDLDMEMLLKIQDEIEKTGINQKNIYELTKNLTEKQKYKLKKLYEEQIEDYEKTIENCKNKIIKIRNNLATNSKK